MKKTILFLLPLLTLFGCQLFQKEVPPANFDECVNAKGTIMESSPRQCSLNGTTFTEMINTEENSNINSTVNNNSNTSSSTGLPNPASVYCEEQGGKVIIKEGEGGQYGICVLKDGTECDEWKYYRGECGKKAVTKKCDSCRMLTPPSPEFCKNGTIVSGGKDTCGCDLPPKCTENKETNSNTNENNTPSLGIANPASVYCQQQGGKLEIKEDADGGQYGICTLKDGTECDEWKYFRGECGNENKNG